MTKWDDERIQAARAKRMRKAYERMERDGTLAAYIAEIDREMQAEEQITPPNQEQGGSDGRE
jgi:hypothetical protein